MHEFTRPDVWSGGNFEAMMCFEACDRQQVTRITKTIWSFERLDGPYLLNNVDPDRQSTYDLSDFGGDGYCQLYGLLKYRDETASPVEQYTLSTDTKLWIYFGPTVGGLPKEWEVGAYPFDDRSPNLWLPPLTEQLRELTDHVAGVAPESRRCKP